MSEAAGAWGAVRRLGRSLVFVAVAAWVWLAPAYFHVFRLHNRHVPEWAMFEAVGVHQCRARFYAVDAEGLLQAVDRRAVLGLDRPRVHRRERAVRRPEGLRQQARAICRREKIADLRADAACATMDGWKQAFDLTENLCADVKRAGRPQAKGRRR